MTPAKPRVRRHRIERRLSIRRPSAAGSRRRERSRSSRRRTAGPPSRAGSGRRRRRRWSGSRSRSPRPARAAAKRERTSPGLAHEDLEQGELLGDSGSPPRRARPGGSPGRAAGRRPRSPAGARSRRGARARAGAPAARRRRRASSGSRRRRRRARRRGPRGRPRAVSISTGAQTPSRAQAPAGLEAVDPRQHHVEDDRVVLGGAGDPERVLAAPATSTARPSSLQPAADQRRHLRLVLDDQNVHLSNKVPNKDESQMRRAAG